MLQNRDFGERFNRIVLIIGALYPDHCPKIGRKQYFAVRSFKEEREIRTEKK